MKFHVLNVAHTQTIRAYEVCAFTSNVTGPENVGNASYDARDVQRERQYQRSFSGTLADSGVMQFGPSALLIFNADF